MGLIWFFIMAFSTVCHEAAHAYAAWKLGDSTAYQGGQVTLDPSPHFEREPVGMILIPWISYLYNGWMMGWASCPYDPFWARLYPKKSALMSLAGPIANLILAIGAGVCIHIGIEGGFFTNPPEADMTHMVVSAVEGNVVAEAFALGLSIAFFLNFIFFFFNLIPIPPLDGSVVLIILLPNHLANKYQDFVQQPGFSVMGVVLAWYVFNLIFPSIFHLSLSLLYPNIIYS